MTKIPRKGVQARYFALLGRIRLDAGDAQAALAPLQQALTLFRAAELGVAPDHAEALVALGRAQLQTGDVDAAARSLASADRAWQAFDSKNRHAGLTKLYLAQALWVQGDKRAGTDALRDAVTVLGASAFAADRDLLQSTRQKFGS
jgi:cytochrome c-type biogenesis protein CcmH/NrfG